MFDVVYLDTSGRESLIGARLPRAEACELARQEARRRHVGRMFLAGSEHGGATRSQVLVVQSRSEAA